MNRSLAAFTLALLFLTPGPARAATYHVDALRGDDASGDGTPGAPYRTLAAVRPLLAGGDKVVLYDGQYGPIDQAQAGPRDLRDDWVTYQAAEGTAPEIRHVHFGRNSAACIGPEDRTGAYDVYLELVGLHITDGVLSYGARHWALIDCVVERDGPWTGSAADIEKTAIEWHGGTDVLIQDCEVTRTANGISGSGHDIRLIGNHIHSGTHDGLRAAGFHHSVVEGNVIHDFDDRVTDDEAEWSRHCDGIHIVAADPDAHGRGNHNVIFRNNVVYDVEGRIVHISGRGLPGNEMIVFENNVFGPGHGTMFDVADPCDTLIFRHNTVVHVPGGRPYNRWLCDNVTLRVSRGSTDVEIYNNILGSTAIDPGADIRVLDWNLVQVPGDPMGAATARGHGRFTILGGGAGFIDPTAMDYRISGDSPAVNAGTRLFAPDPLYERDYEGNPRDDRPDLGVFEVPGTAPPPEDPPQEFPGPKHVFVDDFEDGHWADVDPRLDGPGQQGLRWRQADLPDGYYVTHGTPLDRNALCSPAGTAGEQETVWLLSDQGDDWADYTFEFLASSCCAATSGGPVVLAVDEWTNYRLDIADGSGRLIRAMTDADGRHAETLLAEEPALTLPDFGAQAYRVAVAHGSEGITIQVDAGADGAVKLSWCDTDPLAVKRFARGGVGFHTDAADEGCGVFYDNVRVGVGALHRGSEPLEIVGWDLIENHGTAGEIAVVTQEGHVASSLEGIRKARIVFSRPVDPATVDKSVVSILGQLGGRQSRRVSSVQLNVAGTELTILLSSALPDEDRYAFLIAGSVATPDGTALSGNRGRTLCALAGDAGANGQVSFADMALVRTAVGIPVAPETARYDIDGSGTITATDMLCAGGLEGHLLP